MMLNGKWVKLICNRIKDDLIINNESLKKELESINDKAYNNDMLLENVIEVANKALPTVLIPGISGCDVTLIFAQMDNSDAETKSLQILEHNIIHRRSTGGS